MSVTAAVTFRENTLVNITTVEEEKDLQDGSRGAKQPGMGHIPIALSPKATLLKKTSSPNLSQLEQIESA